MKWSVIWDYREALWTGLALTLQITALSMIGALLLGTVLACLKQLPSYVLSRLLAVYVEVIRNLPSVVKVFFLYFVVGLDAMPAAVIGLSIHQGSYICDVLESGFRSIPREQSEAAWAGGLTRVQIVLFVLLPQVWGLVLPPLTSQFIEILKNSAAAMLLGVGELTFQTQNIDVETFRGFEAATAVTLLYLMQALVIVGAAKLIETRLRWQ